MATPVAMYCAALLNQTTSLPMLNQACTILNVGGASNATMFTDITGSATGTAGAASSNAQGNLTFFVDADGTDGTGRYIIRVAGQVDVTIQVPPRGDDLVHRGGITAQGTDFTSARFGGVVSSSWSTAINNALATLTSGGVLTAPPGNYNISLNHKILQGVNLQFPGGGSLGSAVIFTCTTSAAGISFGDFVTARNGGLSFGFKVVGGTTATNPLYVGIDVGRTFVNVDVSGGTDVCLKLEGTQNCTFVECNLAALTGTTLDAYRLDKGAATNIFLKCEFQAGTRYGASVVASSATVPAGLGTYPLNNVFDTCIFEYNQSATTAMFHQSAGGQNVLRNCIAVAGTGTLILVKLDQTGSVGTNPNGLDIIGGTLQFNYIDAGTVALDLTGNCNVHQSAATNFNSPHTAVRANGAQTSGRYDPVCNTVTTWLALSGGALYYNHSTMMRTPAVQAATTLGTVIGYETVPNELGVTIGYRAIYNSIA